MPTAHGAPQRGRLYCSAYLSAAFALGRALSTDAVLGASLLVVLLSARFALGLALAALAAVAAGRLAAALPTELRSARLALMFGHGDPFARLDRRSPPLLPGGKRQV